MIHKVLCDLLYRKVVAWNSKSWEQWTVYSYSNQKPTGFLYAMIISYGETISSIYFRTLNKAHASA